MNGTESALFVNALGKPQLFSSPALSATDLVSLFLHVEGGKLHGFHKEPVNNDPSQAPYYTDNDQSPYFNQLFAAIYDLPQA